jgi:hypothetical protein
MAVQAAGMDIVTMESCHSTWIFDPGQLRYCRILRDIAVGQRRISTEWRPYWDLEVDPQERNFTVSLNEARTRLVRAPIHTQACVACGARRTAELSLDEIARAVA